MLTVLLLTLWLVTCTNGAEVRAGSQLPNNTVGRCPMSSLLFDQCVACDNSGTRQPFRLQCPGGDGQFNIVRIPRLYETPNIGYPTWVLDFSSNSITSISRRAFIARASGYGASVAVNFTEINLSKNQISYINEYAFEGLESVLTELDLSENRLVGIRSIVFESLHRLRTLHLHNNLLLSANFICSPPPALKNVKLNGNFITSFPSKCFNADHRIFLSHYRLRMNLHLNSNYIAALSDKIINGTRSTRELINMANSIKSTPGQNPVLCECINVWSNGRFPLGENWCVSGENTSSTRPNVASCPADRPHVNFKLRMKVQSDYAFVYVSAYVRNYPGEVNYELFNFGPRNNYSEPVVPRKNFTQTVGTSFNADYLNISNIYMLCAKPTNVSLSYVQECQVIATDPMQVDGSLGFKTGAAATFMIEMTVGVACAATFWMWSE